MFKRAQSQVIAGARKPLLPVAVLSAFLTALLIAALIAALIATSGPARAGSWTAGGWNFSDEMGGFRILSVTGSGTVRDPIVIVEEITKPGIAELVIRDRRDRSKIRPGHTPITHLAANLIKIVFNRTGQLWTGFELELREVINEVSVYQDGLSFDQLRTFSQPVTSNVFTASRRIKEPADMVRFWGGSVKQDGSVRFNFPITDPTVKDEFYLLQQPRTLIAHDEREEPVQVAEIPAR